MIFRLSLLIVALILQTISSKSAPGIHKLKQQHVNIHETKHFNALSSQRDVNHQGLSPIHQTSRQEEIPPLTEVKITVPQEGSGVVASPDNQNQQEQGKNGFRPYELPPLPTFKPYELPPLPTFKPYDFPTHPTFKPYELPALPELPPIPTFKTFDLPPFPTFQPFNFPDFGTFNKSGDFPAFPEHRPFGFPNFTEFPQFPVSNFPDYHFPNFTFPEFPGFNGTKSTGGFPPFPDFGPQNFPNFTDFNYPGFPEFPNFTHTKSGGFPPFPDFGFPNFTDFQFPPLPDYRGKSFPPFPNFNPGAGPPPETVPQENAPEINGVSNTDFDTESVPGPDSNSAGEPVVEENPGVETDSSDSGSSSDEDLETVGAVYSSRTRSAKSSKPVFNSALNAQMIPMKMLVVFTTIILILYT